MKAYLGEVKEEGGLLPRRMIKLGVVGQVLAGMGNVAQYFVNFEGEEISLGIRFEDGERISFTTAGLAGGDPFMEEEKIRDLMTEVLEESRFHLIPELRQEAGQPEKGDPSLEHRFYTALAVYIAGSLPNLIRIQGETAPFSDAAYFFNLNNEKVARVVTFPEIPDDQSQWPELFIRTQRSVVRKAVALAGGDN